MTLIIRVAAVIGGLILLVVPCFSQQPESSHFPFYWDQQLSSAQSPKPAPAHSLPAGVRTEEVKFDGAGVKLAGTLYLPKLEAGKRAPAVLILAASGPAPRDGVPFGKIMHYTYRDIAEHLATRGMVVFSYDQRCVGASGCKPKNIFDDYINDAQEALNYVRGRPEVDPTRVALFGHGEGGFIAGTLGSQDPKLAGVVFAASPGRTLGKVLHDQIQFRLKELGRPEAEIKSYLGKLDQISAGMAMGKLDFSAEKIDPQDALLTELTKWSEYYAGWMINDPLQLARQPFHDLTGRLWFFSQDRG